MAFRHRDMENALGKVLDRTMTVETIEQIVADFSDETEFVDFKSKRELLNTKNTSRNEWRFECGKDVAAFANARGGVLIIGVRDAKNPGLDGARLEPFTEDEAGPADLESLFRGAVRDVTTPVPGFDMFAVTASGDGSFYMVCVVPPSDFAPHAVTMPGKQRSGLVYPSRIAGDSHAEYLREFQVAGLYEQRARSGVDRRRRAERVWSEGSGALRTPGAPQVWLAVASVPDHAGDDLLTAQAQLDIKEWADTDPFPTLIERGFIGNGHLVPAPGRMCLTQTLGRDGSHHLVSAVREFYEEIHADGSAFTAVPLTVTEVPHWELLLRLQVDEIVDIVATSTSHALNWTAHRTGFWGATTVSAGIIVNGPPGTVLEIADHGSITLQREISRRLEHPPRAMTVVQLADVGTLRKRLSAAHRLATPLVQAFGVPNLEWLNESGAVEGYRMRINDQRYGGHIREWLEVNSGELAEADASPLAP